MLVRFLLVFSVFCVASSSVYGGGWFSLIEDLASLDKFSPKPIDNGESCVSFSGAWEGVCVFRLNGEELRDELSVLVEQDKCNKITFSSEGETSVLLIDESFHELSFGETSMSSGRFSVKWDDLKEKLVFSSYQIYAGSSKASESSYRSVMWMDGGELKVETKYSDDIKSEGECVLSRVE